LLYLLSKLFGLSAFVLLCAQVFLTVLGLITKRINFIEAGKSFHIALGLVLTTVILSHASLFIIAVSLRSGHSALHLLLPNLTGGYYALAVSFGVLSLYLVVCSVYFGYKARSRKHKSRQFRNGHLLVYVFSALVLVHARMIGSEIQSGWFQWFYWLAVVCFVVAGLIRLTGLAIASRKRPASEGAKAC
jgi:hypothetical protein